MGEWMYRSTWDIGTGKEIVPAFMICIVLKFCKKDRMSRMD
jgi:hypothetical protein